MNPLKESCERSPPKSSIFKRIRFTLTFLVTICFWSFWFGFACEKSLCTIFASFMTRISVLSSFYKTTLRWETHNWERKMSISRRLLFFVNDMSVLNNGRFKFITRSTPICRLVFDQLLEIWNQINSIVFTENHSKLVYKGLETTRNVIYNIAVER